jgi:hypothetical protein
MAFLFTQVVEPGQFGPVHLAYNSFYSACFSAGTIFFSHKKLVNSVFQPAYNSSRTAPSSVSFPTHWHTRAGPGMTHGTDGSIEVIHPPSTVPCHDGQLSELAKKLSQPPTSACRRRRAAFGKVAGRDARTVAAVARANTGAQVCRASAAGSLSLEPMARGSQIGP